jgi:hypothetical protein
VARPGRDRGPSRAARPGADRGAGRPPLFSSPACRHSRRWWPGTPSSGSPARGRRSRPRPSDPGPRGRAAERPPADPRRVLRGGTDGDRRRVDGSSSATTIRIVATADPARPFAVRRESSFAVIGGAEDLLVLTTPKVIPIRRGWTLPHLDPPQPRAPSSSAPSWPCCTEGVRSRGCGRLGISSGRWLGGVRRRWGHEGEGGHAVR